MVFFLRRRPVALLAEGVDRNKTIKSDSGNRDTVALLAEGVDRNAFGEDCDVAHHASPSSRRAWIEMQKGKSKQHRGGVALLAEGVDRNIRCRAGQVQFLVALLAEGVDRN